MIPPEIKKKIEDMWNDYRFGQHVGTRSQSEDFMAGASAAWELFSTPSEDDEKDAKRYGDNLAKPFLRSMYPSISRSTMSDLLSTAFISGRRCLREAVEQAVKDLKEENAKMREALMREVEGYEQGFITTIDTGIYGPCGESESAYLQSKHVARLKALIASLKESEG